MTITLTESQGAALYKRLRLAWWNDECSTADLDDAMRALDAQLTESRPARGGESQGWNGCDATFDCVGSGKHFSHCPRALREPDDVAPSGAA